MGAKTVIVQPYLSGGSGSTYFPLGVNIVVEMLEENGVETEILDLQYMMQENEPEDLVEKTVKQLKSRSPDYVGFSVMSVVGPNIILISRRLKEELPETEIFLGGPLPTSAGREIVDSFGEIDFTVTGEAEKMLPYLSRYIKGDLELEDVPGTTFRKKGNLVENRPGKTVKGDEIPIVKPESFPDYDRYNIEGGRGCPYNCSYCSSSIMNGKKLRKVPPEKIVDQVNFFREKKDADKFSFTHDLFTLDKNHVMSFCEKVKDLEVEWSCYARTDTLDKEIIDKMDEAGCYKVFMGIETADEGLQEEINKNLDLGIADKIVNYAANNTGITPTTSFIIGLPEGDKETVNRTLEKAVEYTSQGAKIYLSVAVPERGSEMYEKYREKLVPRTSIYEKIWGENLKEAEKGSELIKNHPEIFSHYYRVKNDNLNYYHLEMVRQVFQSAAENFPECLKVLLNNSDEDLLTHINRMMEWNPENITEKEYRNYSNRHVKKKISSYLIKQGTEVRKKYLQNFR